MKTPGELTIDLIAKSIASLPANLKNANAEAPKTGTVILAFPYSQGILIASDRQVSCGYKVFRTNFPKVFQVDGFAALAVCGGVSTCQWILQIYRQIVSQLKMRIKGDLPLRSQIKVFSQLIRAFASASDLDVGGAFIYAGFDPKRKDAALLQFASDGSVFKPNKYHVTDGSGTLEADAVLIEYFLTHTPENLSLNAAVDLAIKAICRSAENDRGVGHPKLNGATVAVIDVKTGFRYVSDEDVEKSLARIEKKIGGRK